MIPTLPLLSKASRLPLNSKMANKNFYKGTGATNIMRRKRTATSNRRTGQQLYDIYGRPLYWQQKTNRIDETRVDSYIVPPGLGETKLKPLVYSGDVSDGGVPYNPKKGFFEGPKMKTGFSFNGQFYEKLRIDILTRRQKAREE